jgi:PAS domain S-box-containing protein
MAGADRRPASPWRYLVGVAVLAAFVGLQVATGLADDARYLLMYPAVLLAVALAGPGAGVLVAVGAIVASHLLLPGEPLRATVQSVIFGLTSLVFVASHAAYRRSRWQLRDVRERLELALRGGDQSVWDWNVRTGAVVFDRRWAELRGLRLEDVAPVEASWRDRVHPDDLPRVQDALQACLDGRAPAYQSEHRSRTASGAWVWVLCRGKVFERDEQGQAVRMVGTEADVTARKELELELRDARSDLARAQQVAGLGSWRLDVTRDELRWSDETYDLFGLPRGAELDYGRFLDRVHPDDRARVDRAWQAALRGAPYDVRHRVVVGDEVRWVRERAELDLDADGTARGGIGTVQDITDFVEAEAALERAKTEAETSNRAKNEFLSTLSHELRTPLTIVMSWAQVLLRGTPDPERTKRGLLAIEQSARAQARVIEDLLDVSRIVTGKLTIEPSEIDLRDVAREVVEAARAKADGKGIRIEVALGASPARVSADAGRMRQVLLNLLDNAVKFTPEGGRIDVVITPISGGTAYDLAVHDTGVGLEPAFLPRLFDRFAQADASTSRPYGGLGLGLALVKSLMELQGGTVRAESPGPGRGATFTVSLPALRVATPA